MEKREEKKDETRKKERTDPNDTKLNPYISFLHAVPSVSHSISFYYSLPLFLPVPFHPSSSLPFHSSPLSPSIENVRLPLNHRQQIHANGSLVISNVHKSDGGLFTCYYKDGEKDGGKIEKKNIFLRVIGQYLALPSTISSAI